MATRGAAAYAAFVFARGPSLSLLVASSALLAGAWLSARASTEAQGAGRHAAPSDGGSDARASRPAPDDSAPSAPAPDAASSSDPIGERCLACHADTVRSYRATGMARALGPIEPGELDGLGAVADGAGWRYRLEQDEHGARILESWSAPGSTASSPERAVPLAFAIGAGILDRSYAAREGELLAFAPLEVVVQEGKRVAALAPGHAIHPGLRFGNPIAEECLACHTDALPPRGYPLDSAPPASWSPRGIACEACHPGSEAHASWRERELEGGEVAGPDPLAAAATGAIESVSACARCHLQGDASILLEPGARGLAALGGDLLEKRAVFVAATPTEDVGFVSHVERLVLSPCFVRSLGTAKELSCTTCHDPHRSVFDPAEARRVREGCLACHPAGSRAADEGERSAAPASSGASGRASACALPLSERGAADCASCHLRVTGVFDVAEVEIHDHWIRARPGPPSRAKPLRIKEALEGRIAPFAWPSLPEPAWADDPGLWTIAYASVGRLDLALAKADEKPGRFASGLATYHHVRGSLLERGPQGKDAIPAYERALAIDPAQAESAVNLGALLGRTRRPKEGIALLDAVIARHPLAEGALRNRALLALQAGDGERFARDLEAAHAIRPQAPVARALAQHWAQKGRRDLAKRWEDEARRLDPSKP